MDIRFLAKLKEAGPTQFEQGRELTNRLAEIIDRDTGRPISPVRVEEAIVALLSVTVQMCVDGGYDPIGVTMLMIEAYDRGGRKGPRPPSELVDA